MNFQRNILSVAAATTFFSLASVAPADAFTFGNSGILFDTDTTIDFNFVQSHGWWFGDFGVKDLSTGLETLLISETLNANFGSGLENDSKGTAGTGLAVENAFSSFTFKADTEYSLVLNSYHVTQSRTRGDLANTVYSTSALNNPFNDPRWNKQVTIGDNNYDPLFNDRTVKASDRVLFEGDLFSGLKLFFEDNGLFGDHDYDDFIVSAKLAQVSVPEPASLLGLGLVAGAMAFSRRRKEGQAS
ncbi:PEP-CTERM sorting domain-containing protein [Oscillatoria acuminata]|uniref:PEP-CTERM putative exosortase interaction domain-containing protein n=1 Tax=Oscillatoria acuminata PCC 6304 TaxID=56110 RepID=K9TJI2_9CYAN|nr:PEP-CTERM sorting domain-containing protein [Oscillatoria acuminata]AFY82286.1 PEP-CTERM putative exosortase interaction domain-containing protein [Oscillatoria acuminata PCC 6304]